MTAPLDFNPLPSAPGHLTIVVGICGGIAAYKAVSLVRSLVLAGHDVHVIATPAALRFIGAPTLEAISRNVLNTDLYEGVAEVRHVAIGQGADLIIVAPATAHSIAKMANGIADDLLQNTILATRAPVVIAPAMHTEMWQNAATVANIAVLRERGVTVIGPAIGQLTGSDTGAGRMVEPDEIMAHALGVLHSKDFTGRRILISAGGTREALDPVRYLGNRSSGKQGVALAVAARSRGAEVTVVGANLEVEVPSGIHVVPVVSTGELADALTTRAPNADLIIMAAAVADYRPETVSRTKMAKETQGDSFTLKLIKNPDILAQLGESRIPGQIIVGFAAETETDDDAMVQLGRSKIRRKGSDFLVINRVGWHEGFATDTNRIVVVDSLGAIVMEASGSKLSVADRILDVLA